MYSPFEVLKIKLVVVLLCKWLGTRDLMALKRYALFLLDCLGQAGLTPSVDRSVSIGVERRRMQRRYTPDPEDVNSLSYETEDQADCMPSVGMSLSVLFSRKASLDTPQR